MNNIQIVTIVCIIIYIMIIIISAKLLSRKSQNIAGSIQKKLPWYVIAGCTMATVTNAAQMLSQAGSTYVLGYAQMFWTNVFAALVTMITIPLVAERLRTIECNSLAELSIKRFPNSKGMNVVMSTWTIVWGMFACALAVFGGAVVLQTLFGLNFWVGAIITMIVSLIYNAVGGLEAMSIIDNVQYILIGIMVSILTPALFIKFGSFSSFAAALVGTTGYNITKAGTAMGVTEGFFNIFNMPGWGPLSFVSYVLACSLWTCCDIGVMQRFLAQDKPGAGVKGLRAYVIIFVPTLLLLCSFGLWGRGMFANVQNIDSVVLLVAKEAMGDIGTVLFVVATIAAILSTVGAYLNALGIMSINIYRKKVTNKSEAHYRSVEVMATVIICVISLIGASFFGYAGIAITAVAVQMILVATFTPVVMFSCFWKRFNEKAAFWGVVIGVVVCVASTLYAGGAYSAIMGAGFFGIPTLFLGWLVTIPIFLILSLYKSYDPMDTSPEFRELFAMEHSFTHYEGKGDVIFATLGIVVAVIVASLGFTGKLGAFPTFDNSVADLILILFTIIAGGGAVFLGIKLFKFTYIDKTFFEAEENKL